MNLKRIGDYIGYDFHTPNTKEVREFLEKEFVVSEAQFNEYEQYITPNRGMTYLFTTECSFAVHIPTEDFKQLIGMTKKEENNMTTKQKGYKLADGSCSSEYKIGDKFEVVDDSAANGRIITFTKDDGSKNPYFDTGVAYSWFRLQPVATKKSDFTKSYLKDGMVVTTRNGNVYTVKGVRLLRDGGGFLWREDFDDDLTCSAEYGNGNEEFDIISVQQTVTLFKRETEAELKQQRIAKELEFAEAKRERLNAHIERLKRNLAN